MAHLPTPSRLRLADRPMWRRIVPSIANPSCGLGLLAVALGPPSATAAPIAPFAAGAHD